MIVKGLIKSIDYSDNSCMVRLPIFETAATKSEVVLKAVMLSQPGMYNGYAEGDVVFVDFENDKLNQPIVIGKLFLGPAKENTAPTALSVANLTVSKSATLPIDTKLVLEDSGGAVPVENGITSYKSLTDIIKALYKAESSAGQIVQVQSDSISNIKVEYLSQPMGDPEPEVDDERWAVSTPTYAEGMSIWQKTTCYNSRGQILNAEILCLSTAVSSASYRLRCSSRIHAAKNQAEPITIQAMVKLGTSLEVEDTSAFIGYSWGKDGTETLIKGANLTLTAEQLQEKNLLVTFKHTNALDETKYDVYDTDTVMYAPLNTPVLHLDNEADSITYAADGTTALSDPVTSTAALYLNGDLLDADYSWELTNCSNVVSDTFADPITVSNTNTITIKSINSSTRAGTAVCTATVKQDGAFNGKSYTKVFSVTQTRVGENASSYWLASTCRAHIGTKQKDDIIITAKKQYGISPEEVDKDAYIWFKYSSAATWTKSDPQHRLLIPFEDVIDDAIIVVATHDIMFDPTGMSDVDLIASDAVYEMEEIPFSPLNTPIVNLTNDMAAIAYTATGLKLNDEDVASTTAELYLNGSQIIGNLTYSWELVNCKDDQDRSGTGNVTTPTIHIKTLEADVATATCTITYKEESYSKTFTIAKQIQGKSPYVVDIYNDFVTVPAGDDGKLSNAIKANLEALTTHTVSCYHGDELITITSYGSTTPTTNDKLFRIKYTYTPTEVTLSTKSALKGPNFAITNLSATVGYINYELYQGKTRLASAKFEVSKLLQGESGVTYWLKLSSGIHLGKNHQSPLEVTAMQKIGNDGIEDIDENAQLFYRYKEELEWTPVQVEIEGDPENYATHYLALPAKSLEDQDLIIKAIHTIDGVEVEYETETITYSPLNTPALNLDNDTDTILYPAKPEDDHRGPLGDPVTSKATLYLNGDPLEASYSWTLVGCSVDFDGYVDSAEGQEVTVTALSEDSGRAMVTARVTAEGAFKGKVYSKTFTVSKTRKGDNGINSIGYSLVVDQPNLGFGAAEVSKAVTITGTCYIHDGNDIQPFGGAIYNYKVDTFDESDRYTADSNGQFKIENVIVASQIEVRLLVDGKIIDKELIRVIRDGQESASIESQTTYYALIHPDYKAGEIQAPTGDDEDGRLVREAGTGAVLNRLDIADTVTSIEEARTWGPWTVTPPSHTENTNGWKYWTTIRTKFSNTIVPQYSIPITNEDLSSVYALAQGKTTSYYSSTDPAKHYEIKKGDCWFCTPSKKYTYTLVSTPSAAESHLYIGYYISPDEGAANDTSVYLEVTEHTLDPFLRGEGIMTIVPGTTLRYARSEAKFAGGVLYQWNGEQWEDIGEEILANKITANYINAFDITAKKLKVLDTDNTTLFEADGSDGVHKVQIGGFNVVKNTLTTGNKDNGNLIELNSDNTNIYTVGGVNDTEIKDSTSWASGITSKWANIFATSTELFTIPSAGVTGENLAPYTVKNTYGGNAFWQYAAVTKVTFKQAMPSFTLYLNHTSGFAGDYMLASKCYPKGYSRNNAIPGHSGHDAVYIDPINGKASTSGKSATQYVKATYTATTEGTSIQEGDFIYLVYIHAESTNNETAKAGVGSFYLPTNIRLSIGDKFQVLADGTVYAKNLFLGSSTPTSVGTSDNGNINVVEADSSGTLAAVKIISGGFDKKTNLNDDTKGGVYFGPDGLSIGTGFKIEAGGGARFSNAIRDDLRGFSIVANVDRPSFTEEQWTTYGTTGHEETWSGTSTTRNGCRVGDMFTVTGTATDSGKAHVLYYRSTTASGDLQGTCVSHSISERGVAVSSTTKYYKLSTENLASDGNQPNILEPSSSASAERNRNWNKSPATFPTGGTGYNYYESVRSIYADGSFEWSVPVKNSMLTVEFINSLGISAKHIEVTNISGNTLFKAAGLEGGGYVDIAGFTVNQSTLTAGTASSGNYVQLGTEAIMLGGNNVSTAPFSVTKAGALTATSGKIAGFDISGAGIVSSNGNLQLGSDGTLYAKSANIEGSINADNGQIAGLNISPTSLSSDFLQISNQAVWFKDAGLFQMGEDFSISSQTFKVKDKDGNTVDEPAVVMQTLGQKALYLKNTTGAGIKFNLTEVSQSAKSEVTIKNIVITPHEDWDSGYTSISCNVTFTLEFDWEWTNGSGSLSDIYGAVDMKVTHEYWSWGDHSDPYTYTAQFNIVGGQTSGHCKYELGENEGMRVFLSGTDSYTIHGIRKAGTSNAYGTSDFVYYTTDASGTNKTLYSLGSFCPNTTSTSETTGFFLGDDSHVWNTIRAYTAVISTSDARVKTDVETLPPAYEALFDNLRPVSYKYINGDSKRTHVGFIAQEVETGLNKANISTADFAGLCIGKDENNTYALRYEEFIPLNTAQIQKLKKQVAEQDARIAELENLVKELKT